MLKLSGCFPSLVKGIYQHWSQSAIKQFPLVDWHTHLKQEHSITFRIEQIWNGLTQEEQHLLRKVEKGQMDYPSYLQAGAAHIQQSKVLTQLESKGLCQPNHNKWVINGTLLSSFISSKVDRGRGRIILDDNMLSVIQDDIPIELAPMEFNALKFFIAHPYKKHTVDKIIDNTWPEEEHREGITNNALHVQIRNIRRKIEPDPANPKYLITWHGRPGGYIFYPEGKPT
jgi:hypothetical protein